MGSVCLASFGDIGLHRGEKAEGLWGSGFPVMGELSDCKVLKPWDECDRPLLGLGVCAR